MTRINDRQTKLRKYPTFEERVSIEPNSGCWLWTGQSRAEGYGFIQRDGKATGAHRYSYELHVGPIPKGMCVCHHCDNPPCVNPQHLFLGTDKDNVDDMIRKGRGVAHNSAKTHCPSGHAYAGSNLHVSPNGRRYCRIRTSEEGASMSRINEHHIGWWCPSGVPPPTLESIEHGDGLTCPRCIPVFAPLATPELSTETRADMEACAEVVVAVAYDDDVRMCLPSATGPDDNGIDSERWAAWWDLDRLDGWDLHPMASGKDLAMYDNTEADAVLWVCEGKLPGGES